MLRRKNSRARFASKFGKLLHHPQSVTNDKRTASRSREGVIAFDCMTGKECIFILGVLLKSADNPQAAEDCSHIGLNGNFFCFRCKVGGNQAYKASDEGFHSLFSVRVSIILRILHI